MCLPFRKAASAATLLASVLAGSAAAQIDFGDDSGAWTNDGECDDPRFAGDGMASYLTDDDLYKDATDCRTLLEQGRIRLSDRASAGRASAGRGNAGRANAGNQGTNGPSTVGADTGDTDANGAGRSRVELGRLEPGDTTLTSGEYVDTYTIVGEAGDEIVIDLRSEAFDPYLIVETPGGEQLENDDYAGNTSRSLLTMVVEDSGVHEVSVTTYEAGETGEYALTLTLGAAAAYLGSLDERGDLGAGDATLDSGEYFDQHEFTGRAGQRVAIDLRSDDFDTYLIVVPPEGDQLENDDADDTGHSRVELDVAETGTYRVIVTSYEPGESGRYRLRVDPLDARQPGAVTAREAEPISLGQTIVGRLESGDASLVAGEYRDDYAFEGTAGQSVSIDLLSTDFDTYLAVTTPAGNIIQNDDYESDTGRSSIRLTLRESGRYEIVATSYAAEETGAYRLSVAVDDEANAPRLAGHSRIYGIFAGISDYGGRVGNLEYTAEDATRIRDALIRGAGMRPADAVTLVDAQATRVNFAAAIDDLAERVGPDDMFVLFYSGHGDRVPRPSGPAQTDPDAFDETIELYDDALLDDELHELLGRIRAGTALIILDSCFSGGFAKDVVSVPGRMGMFSSEEDVVSAVAAKFRAGGFLAHFFDEAIGQALADEDLDGRITALELSQYIHERYRVDVASKSAGSHVDLRHLGYQHVVVDRGGLQPFDVLFELPPSR